MGLEVSEFCDLDYHGFFHVYGPFSSAWSGFGSSIRIAVMNI